jgi:hypothetical protein
LRAGVISGREKIIWPLLAEKRNKSPLKSLLRLRPQVTRVAAGVEIEADVEAPTPESGGNLRTTALFELTIF